MELRLATPADAAEIAEIYNREVTGSTATFDLVPRSVADQRQWILDRSGAYAATVAVVDGRIAGFASVSPYRDRPAYRTTVENSVYVHHEHHRKGVGRALMEHLLAQARAHGFHSVIARVAAGQDASVALHEAVGFTLVGVEREVGRKFGRWLDVVILQILL